MDDVTLYMIVLFGGLIAIGAVIAHLAYKQRLEDEADAHDIPAE